jgi:hypothetical protein
MNDGSLGGLATTLLAAGGGGAAVAFAIFKGFGAKWMDQRFGAAIERQRHEHASALEHLKLGFSQQLDRSVKLANREFELLPELWRNVVEAEALARLTYIRFSSHSDFAYLSDEDCAAYLQRIEVPEHHQKEILAVPARERNSVFGRSQQLIYQAKAWGAHSTAATNLERASIFIPPDLHSAISEFLDLIRRAIVDGETRSEVPGPRTEFPDAERLRKEGAETLATLRMLVRARLQP